MNIRSRIFSLIDPRQNVIFPGDLDNFFNIFEEALKLRSYDKEKMNVLNKRLNFLFTRNIIYPNNIQSLKFMLNNIYKTFTPDEDTQSDMYDDPVKYNSEHREEGKYYIIDKKVSDKKKILAEAIFRMNNRNVRLPEYLSGILCTVNNLHAVMGPEWGYRLYIDINFLKRNKVVKNEKNMLSEGSNYTYGEFSKNDQEKWKELFENKDEGLIFSIFLDQMNSLNYVEIFKVTLKDQRLIDEFGYPVGLIGTNYRFHASLDKTKDLVYMKDADTVIAVDSSNNWKRFENSEKKVAYYFLPGYKPPSHALVQYPFTIIAYFWGIKPKLIDHHYDFDSIFEYFLNFDDKDPNMFSLRKPSANYKEKAAYGSDEIILTDLIFSGFKAKDTAPLCESHNFRILSLFYIVYESLINDSNKKNEFTEILKEELENLKKNVDNFTIEEKKIVKEWNLNNIQEFLFGNESNKYCCIFPLYKNIPDKTVTKIFCMAYASMIYDMIENNNTYELNFRESYYKLLVEYMKKYSNNTLSEDQINSAIFNHTLSNNEGWSPYEHYKRIILPNNENYMMSRYLNQSVHIPSFSKYENPFWKFIVEVSKRSIEMCSENVKNMQNLFFNNFSESKRFFINNLWITGEKNFDRCIAGKPVTLQKGGYGTYGYNYYNQHAVMDCSNPGYPVKIYEGKPVYYIYEKRYGPILLNNKIISDNICKELGSNELIARESLSMSGGSIYKQKYLKYKARYLELKKRLNKN